MVLVLHFCCLWLQLVTVLAPHYCWYYWDGNKVEFDMAPQVLKILYRQAIIWVSIRRHDLAEYACNDRHLNSWDEIIDFNAILFFDNSFTTFFVALVHS